MTPWQGTGYIAPARLFPGYQQLPVLLAAGEYDGVVAQGDGLLNHDLDPTDPHARGPQDACGVFGVWAPHEDVAKLTYFGLYALQHRGQESAGIAVSKGSQIVVFKDMGLVSQVFNEATLDSLGNAHLAIGHCRYSTTGASVWKNAQPTFRSTAVGSIALGHNGNLTNALELQSWLKERDHHNGSYVPIIILIDSEQPIRLITAYQIVNIREVGNVIIAVGNREAATVSGEHSPEYFLIAANQRIAANTGINTHCTTKVIIAAKYKSIITAISK